MPELPEVETVRRVLEPQIQGLAIKNITINRSEVIAYPDSEGFCRQAVGQVIDRMERRGKFLIMQLDGGDRIIIHLRMTGCLLFTPHDYPLEKHTHLIFHLSSGKELRFSDTRRFGRLWLIPKGECDTYSGIENLGIEPFSAELNAEYLKSDFGKRKKKIKECLLEQGVIAGIGNIYSDEILFASGIYPARAADSLTSEDWERLAKAIPQCLSYFLEKNKLSPEEYLETKGKDYRNTPFLQVYGHEGEPCPNCGNPLCRIAVGGRGSVYCPCCQPK